MVLDNEIRVEGSEAIADALKINSCLQLLSISSNYQRYLHVLMILDNRIGVEGIQAIADALQINSCLQSLDISCNIRDIWMY